MAINLHSIKRSFITPITVGEVKNTHKQFYEGIIDNYPFELSVLGGLHRESFEEAKADIQKILPFLRRAKGVIKVEEDFLGVIDHPTLSPSAMFALESWLFRRTNLSQKAPWNLPVTHNALLLSPSLSSLKIARERGYSSFKIKIGRGESANDILTILKELTPNELVRLDGNQHFSFEALETLIEALGGYHDKIEYIEEPFIDYTDNRRWDHPVSLALDESLSKMQLSPNIKYAVLKPGLYGFAKSVRIIREFAAQNVTTTLSSTFEGEIGLAAITHLASLQNSFKPNPAGLATLEYFS